MSTAFDKDGNEIEVFTADEHKAAIATEVAKEGERVKGEYTPKLTAAESELELAKKALGERAGEFKQFRELHADVVAKLSVTERALYENQLAAEKKRVEDEVADKKRKEEARDKAIRAKAGTDDKLFGKMKDMYELIGVQATTQDEIENKVKMVLGAIGTTEPDLVASVAGFQGGSFKPPVKEEKQESFADTERGKQAMSELGIVLPEKK